jgi:D-alanyl-lipoteichoic acid acyltransferase DltB (MBOAT superfamily)
MLYWSVSKKALAAQNWILLIGSYIFYAWWDWRFLSLIILTSLVCFTLGNKIANSKSDKQRSTLLTLGVCYGIGLLVFFKYCNFFIESIAELLALLNLKSNIPTLNIILPLGISFYIFRSLSYLFDVNNEEIHPTKNPLTFFTYIAFFPSLLSGPIDRAKVLVPQLEQQREFNYSMAVLGLRQILWGLFKKLVIADNCLEITDQIFNNYLEVPASSIFLGAFFFTVMVYTDFSGYSDMAIGIARILGFNLARNFNYPFFALNISDFWQRWHISLTSWMTDYVFTPLSFVFRRLKKRGLILAILINFLLVGLWHGANWTYVVFGLSQGCFFIPLILSGNFGTTQKIDPNKILPSIREVLGMLSTFWIVAISSILFVGDNLTHAFQFYKSMFSISVFKMPILNEKIIITTIMILFLLVIEWIGRNSDFAIEKFVSKFPMVIRWCFYSFIVFLIGLYMNTSETPFIYFKF